jgi:hypothetical protein
MTKIAKKALSLGLTEKAYLEQVIANNCKVELAAMDAGVAVPNFYAALKRNNLEWKTKRNFEMDGIVANFKQHCERLGLVYSNVQKSRIKRGVSKIEAIQFFLTSEKGRYALSKTRVDAFHYRDVCASFLGHCVRLGLNYQTVYKYRTRNCLTKVGALNHFTGK